MGLRKLKERGSWLNALRFGLLGGIAGLAVDIDYLLHLWLGFPYRFWHTPMLIFGSCLTVACIFYLHRNFPSGRGVYKCLLVLVVALALVTHVLEDYLLGWF